MAIKIQTSSFSYGRRGDALVQKSKKTDMLIVKFLDDEEQFRVSYPDTLVPHPEKVHGTFRVALDDYHSTLRFIAPINDIVKGVFLEFTRNDEGSIVVKSVEERSGVKNGRKWVIPEHLEFYARFYLPEVGIIVPHRVPFAFIDVDGEAGIAGFGVGKLREFLTATGVDFANDTLKFGDEILEDLEAILQKRKQTVKLSFENGYIKNLTAFQSFSTLQVEDEEEEEEETPPKKVEAQPKKVEGKSKDTKSKIDELLDLWEE